MTQLSLLEAKGLQKRFGDVDAVSGIDLKIEPGTCLALLGPNGAGKTTTVEMLNGLQKPDKGEIFLLGKELSQHSQEILQEVGVLLQETRLYRKMTIRETLKLFRSFFKSGYTVDQAIEMVGLQDKANVRLEKLSGGQLQRAYLACAFINRPKLLFLDEPSTGLDPQSRRSVWELLEKQKELGCGILLTTHYMDEAQQLADNVAIIDHGKIIAYGSPRELIKQYCEGEILRFSLESKEKQQALDSGKLKKELPWLENASYQQGMYEIASHNMGAIVEQLIRSVDQVGAGVGKLEMRRSTLEDVFIKLTGRSIRDA